MTTITQKQRGRGIKNDCVPSGHKFYSIAQKSGGDDNGDQEGVSPKYNVSISDSEDFDLHWRLAYEVPYDVAIAMVHAHASGSGFDTYSINRGSIGGANYAKGERVDSYPPEACSSSDVFAPLPM